MDKEEGMGYIYRGYLISTGESYIGAAPDLKLRIRQHSYATEKHSKFHQSIKEHGFDKFAFEVLEKCKISEMHHREIFWIATLGTNGKFGYNKHSGGYHVTEKSRKKMQKPKNTKYNLLTEEEKDEIYDTYMKEGSKAKAAKKINVREHYIDRVVVEKTEAYEDCIIPVSRIDLLSPKAKIEAVSTYLIEGSAEKAASKLNTRESYIKTVKNSRWYNRIKKEIITAGSEITLEKIKSSIFL